MDLEQEINKKINEIREKLKQVEPDCYRMLGYYQGQIDILEYILRILEIERSN